VDLGQPSSYLTLEPGADVVSSDGERVGKVEHVLAAEEEDIFDGLVIDTVMGPGGLHFVDSEQVEEIYERGVVIKVPAAEVDRLPKPSAQPTAMEAHADSAGGPLASKLRRAWDLISGNY
jgi:hypothetical protein